MSDDKEINQNQLEELKNEFEINGQSYFVLHVDDEAEIRSIFSEDLKEFGVTTLSAASGSEALELLKANSDKIMLVASDIKMPEMDGFAFRSEALSLYPQVPFCIVSAHVNREMALRGIELKISAFLSKPLDSAEIFKVLQKEALPRLRALKEDAEFKRTFVADVEPLLEESEEILLRLEQDFSDTESINRFYAIMHTIKGPSGFFEPKTLHKFVHSYEEIIKKIQRFELVHSTHVANVLIDGFDIIKKLVNEIKEGRYQPHKLEELTTHLNVSGVVSPAKKDDKTTPTSEPGPTKDLHIAKTKTQEDIKVSVKLLDEFMQFSGEVTVIRNMLNKCVSSIERRFAGDHDVSILSELLSELHKVNSNVQNKITEIRKVPIKSVVKLLPRAVRDVAKSLNKKIDLEIQGEDLRVDTSIADVLNNSLLHVIKNSIDHGIETPEERIKCAKNETGKIKVSAKTRDEKVYVEISDDGQGLNTEAIKNKLVKNGTHTRAQADALGLSELHQMIFSSGFSTAAKVTEISGRGVGMSMVRDCVDGVGGQIDIKSMPGKGASFTLELPVPKSVQIASCLTVRIGARKFSLMQDDILRVVQFIGENSKTFIKQLEKSEHFVFDGELVPIADICQILKINRHRANGDEPRRLILMKAGQDKRLLAIEVDEIYDVEDMVIKSLHSSLNTESLYRGVTFLDDGGLGLILSTSGIMDTLQINQNTKRNEIQGKIVSGSSEIPNDVRQALTFQVDGVGTYAIPESSVFRIEEIEMSSVKRSGKSFVIPYRGSPLQIKNLSQLLGKNSVPIKTTATSEDTQTKAVLIIVKKENYFFGMAVDKIYDVVTYSGLNEELKQDDQAIAGHLFIGDKTVPLLNTEAIWSNIRNEYREAV